MARRTPATSKATRPARTAAPAPPASEPVLIARPDVIVDFSVERGLLFVVLRNIGAASAYGVVTRFDQAFHGLGGTKDISTLALFRKLAFMPPGKQFTQLVDPVAAYFQRDEPARLTATLTYRDREGHRYAEEVPHDLAIYQDLAEAVPR